MLNLQMEFDIPPFVARAPAGGIDTARWEQAPALRTINGQCDAAHTGRARLRSISRSRSNALVGSETMDSRSIELVPGDGAGESTAAALPDNRLSGRLLIEKPFKAVFKAMLRIGDDYAAAQEMARQAQKKSPPLRE